MREELTRLSQRVETAKKDCLKTLAKIDAASHARVATLRSVSASLSGAPADVQDYFSEALFCTEHGVNRAAIVLSWSGFFSLFTESLIASKGSSLSEKYKKWDLSSADTLSASAPDNQIIKAAKTAGFISNSWKRVVDGQLARRNQCAHPTVYKPSLNLTIGYLDEMVEQSLMLVHARKMS